MEALPIVGSTALLTSELMHKQESGELSDFIAALDQGTTVASVSTFSGGMLNPSDTSAIRITPGNTQAIGIGKPLTIKFESVYCGKYSIGGWFDEKDLDILVTSSMKSLGVTQSQPRALNLLEKKVARYVPIHQSTPTQPGTELIFHTAALSRLRGTLQIEISADDVDTRQFDAISSFMKGIGGLTMFLPYVGYVMAGAQIVNIIGKFGNSIMDSKPEWKQLFNLDLQPILGSPLSSGLYLLIDDQVWRELAATGHTIDGKVIKNQSGNRYAGKEPYAVISVDGRPDPGLADFQPMSVSSEIMSRFLADKDKLSASLDSIKDLLVVAHDWKYAEEAKQYHQTYARLLAQDPPADQQEVDKVKRQRDAAVANIREPSMKPEFK